MRRRRIKKTTLFMCCIFPLSLSLRSLFFFCLARHISITHTVYLSLDKMKSGNLYAINEFIWDLNTVYHRGKSHNFWIKKNSNKIIALKSKIKSFYLCFDFIVVMSVFLFTLLVLSLFCRCLSCNWRLCDFFTIFM